jgi:hypothetical protein
LGIGYKLLQCGPIIKEWTIKWKEVCVIRQILRDQNGEFLYLLLKQLSGKDIIYEKSLLEMKQLGKMEVVNIP